MPKTRTPTGAGLRHLRDRPEGALNNTYRDALLVERAGIAPFVELPNRKRRLAEIDAELATLDGPAARAAHIEAANEEATASEDVSAPPAAEVAISSAPKETAVIRRGKTSKEN